MILEVLVTGWLALALIPIGWWWRTRRRVDVWRSLPVPAALLAPDGTVRALAGPPAVDGFTFDGVLPALPARDRVVRLRSASGAPLAATGVRGGALVLALTVDPLREHRDRLVADLGSRLAHDINTPLAALVGHLDLLAHEPLGPVAAASVATCQRELARLQTTTSDLLTLTRLRANPGPRRVCLAGALVEDAAGVFLDQADALGVVLAVEVPPSRVAVEVAEADVVRALRNLIGNALRHGLPPAEVRPAGGVASVLPDDEPRRGPAGPEIVVAVESEPDVVTFSVVDRGQGMDAAQLAALCDPLVRGKGAVGEGSGLGLAIVTEVLAGHGSALHCRPRPDGGAVMFFALPRSR